MSIRRDPLDDAELIGGFGDYDEDSPASEYELHAIQAPPFLEHRRDGSKEWYLPVSPRTLQPAPFARAFREWQNLPDGIRGRKAGGGPPGLWSYDTEALVNPRLARLRAGLAAIRADAGHMAKWMQRFGGRVGQQAARVYELFFLQGFRRRAIAGRLDVTVGQVARYLERLRAEAGSPLRGGRQMRPSALQAARTRPLGPGAAPLRPTRATGSPGGYG